MKYTVKALATLAGVSIRTLHHYDAMGLLTPSETSEAGYRLYTRKDLEKLQQILFFRELEFSLQDIRSMMDDPAFRRRDALEKQRQVLLEKHIQVGRLVQTIDRTLKEIDTGETMKDHELFDGTQPHVYEEEAKAKWGHTPAWAESKKRTSKYSKADWMAIHAEAGEITTQIAQNMDKGAGAPDVQKWVAKHHEHINKRYYTCPAEMYRGLGDMYVQDERFTANWDKVKPGLALFVNQAIHIYCNALAASEKR